MEFYILVILGGILYGIWLFFKEIVRAILLRNFKKKVAPVIPAVDKQLEVLKSLFVPNKPVLDEEIEKFISDNKDLRDSVWNLYTQERTIFNEYLDSTSIKLYKEQTTPYELRKQQKENNAIADAIDELKTLTSKAFESFNALYTDSHYFTYSEM